MATRDYSSKQEKAVADYLDAKTTPNSGATLFKKGDITTEDSIIECKTKTKESTSHTIKKEWIDTLKRECISMGKDHWLIVFDFGTQKIEDQLVVLPISYYKELIENMKEEI